MQSRKGIPIGRIGYYIHHHGDGHRQRALSLAATDPALFTLLGTGLTGRTGVVASLDLPDDRTSAAFDGQDNTHHRPQALHYAPVDHGGVRKRMSMIASWTDANAPSLMIVDVSVEVAFLARLCATRVAYVRLGGRRDDRPHLEAFRAASVLIAPFAEPLDDPQIPDWIRQKTLYAPGLISRGIDARPRPGRILVVAGRGGSSITATDILSAARATPGETWRVIGIPPPDDMPTEGAEFVAWSDDPQREISSADVVVGAAGDGLVSAVLAARRPFVCIPQPRPFGEQFAKAEALARAGAAIVSTHWPADTQWRDTLAAARSCDPAAQAALDDPHGPENLMKALRVVADHQK